MSPQLSFAAPTPTGTAVCPQAYCSAASLRFHSSPSLLKDDGSLSTCEDGVYRTLTFGWRVSFLIPLVAGLVWVPAWWYANSVTKPDSPASSRVAFSMVWLRVPRVAAYILVRFFGDSSGYFFNFWMPEYLVSAKHFSFTRMGMVAWIPPCSQTWARSWAASHRAG